MDLLLSRRLEKEPEYRKKINTLAKDYLRLGRDALAYWSSDFDSAYDTMACYAALTKKDIEKLERGHPRNFILPMTATQITTMTTYVAQVLFGQETPHKVEGRGPDDDIPAEFMNQLLRWNAEQQKTYEVGYLWCQDAIAVNRGVFYNSWKPILRPEVVTEDIEDPESPLDTTTGKRKTFKRTRTKNKVIGSYNRMELVSPYDFVCDPSLPLWRLEEHRFAGHRTVIPVTELERRAKLDPSHPDYVMPWAVKEVKEKLSKGAGQTDTSVPSLPGISPTPTEQRLSRTAYERTRNLKPTGADKADKLDAGNCECWCLWVKLNPDDFELYGKPDDGSNETNVGDNVIFQILIGSAETVLAVNESTYAHGQFPYSVGEGRPNAHFQFSPGWVWMLKGIQDHVDWLKNRHQEALSRTIGNIFVFDPASVDVADFMNPDKEGLLISLKPEAAGKRISDVFQQVQIRDMTENFQEEAAQFMQFAESVTSANSGMQGAMNTPGGDPSATQFAGTQQMAAGRMTSIARLLSSQAIVPQTQQFVSNFQQFMEGTQVVRFVSDRPDLPAPLVNAKAVNLNRDVIQGNFDFVAHDGTLPGTDGKKVAAITRLLESAALFPQVFTQGEGNLDPKLLIYAAARAAGVNVEQFQYRNLSPAAPEPGGVPAPTLPPVALPGGAQAPGPAPAVPALPPVEAPALEPVAPSQPRPGII